MPTTLNLPGISPVIGSTPPSKASQTAGPANGSFQTPVSLRRFSIDEYHRMIEYGILTTDDRIELLNGYLVNKMPIHPPHATATTRLFKWFVQRLIAGWTVRSQQPVTFAPSEPEPDVTVARGDEATYSVRHPGPADVGILIEVAESTLERDRTDKSAIYAAAGIPVYWIVNLIDRVIEVYTDPTPDGEYRSKRVFLASDSVPVELDGKTVGSLPIAEVI